jgi:hypothetical protein
MALLELEKISAVIKFGGYTFTTPGRKSNSSGDILNFSITRNRTTSSPIAQLNCSFSAWMDSKLMGGGVTITANLGDKVVVQAGVGDDLSSLPTLFTGYVTTMRPRPHWRDARKIVVEIQAEDEFVKMKPGVGAKFTRRFKITDDAFAIITGGHRRSSGQMYLAHKAAPGKQGISYLGNDSSMGEHSPLIKTPDPQGKSPNGITPGSGAVRNEMNAKRVPLRAEPNQAWVSAGMRIFVQIMEVESGEVVNVEECEQIGACCCFCNPTPKAFSGSRGSSVQGIKPGEVLFPVSVKLGTTADATAKGYEFIITGDYPARITFVHPKTGQTCAIDFQMIPPHDHRDIARGGPAVGSFDVFQI